MHEIRRPKSLKIIPSGVTNCRNLPFGRRATQGLTGASSKTGKCAESPPTFIRGKIGKTGKVWSTNFNCKSFGGCFYARRRYQHPTRPSQRTTTFNQVCKYDFYFPFFLCLFVFLCFLCFFCILYLVVVDKGVSLAPTYPQLR